MNQLLEKYNDYQKLVGCSVCYELANGDIIEYVYKEENFAHMIGLHKLKDIQVIQFWLDKKNPAVRLKDIYKRIKNGKLTDEIIRNSIFFHKVQYRYNQFCFDNLTTLNYTNAIIDFNASLIDSKLQSNYLLFEEKNNGYNHMGIAKDIDQNYNYVETFFHEPSNKYLSDQMIVRINKFSLKDKNNVVIVEDHF